MWLKKRQENKVNKGISVALALVIIGLLVVVGPASAINLALNLSDSEKTKGENLGFSFELNIRGDEIIQGNPVLYLDGVEYCRFFLNGSLFSGCSGISIAKSGNASFVSGNGYGYGYNFGYGYNTGFSNGILNYDITLDTEDLSIGEHDLKIELQLGDKVYSSGTKDFTVVALQESNSENTGNSGGGGNANEDDFDNLANDNRAFVSANFNNVVGGDLTDEDLNALNNVETLENTESNRGGNPITGAVVGVGEFASSTRGFFIIILGIVALVVLLAIGELIKLRRLEEHDFNDRGFYS